MKAMNKRFVLYGGVIIVFVIIALEMVSPLNKNTSNVDSKNEITSVDRDSINSTNVSRYYFETLNFSIEIPDEYKYEEKFNVVTLVNDNDQGIVIDRIGTNHENITDHLDTLEELNNLRYIERNQIEVNNYDAEITYLIMDNVSTKTYFIYSDYQVYSFSTSFTEMYEYLDQIVYSFSYLK